MARAAWAQAEVGAAAAIGTVGSAAGKKVSDGVLEVSGKIGEQTKEAAQEPDPPSPKPVTTKPSAPSTPPDSADAPAASKPAAKPKPKAAIKPAPKPDTVPEPAAPTGVVRINHGVPYSVPDPPAPSSQHSAASKTPQPASAPEAEITPVLPLPSPQPREATIEDLKAIIPGTGREDLLKLGSPASRITMIDDGHLLEIYSYMTRDMTFGVVRLSDGRVSRVELR